MSIRDFKLVHRLKSSPKECAALRSEYLFYLDTCQRQLWITPDSLDLTDVCPGAVVYTGDAAYHKLLKVACGLESRVIGETEVYAQFRKARREQCGNKMIDGLLTKLFEDVKFIRNEYLTGIGGQSYGTLVRKRLQPSVESHLLIVGAGALAGSIVPMLTRWRLTISNRTLSKAQTMADTARRQGDRIDAIDSPNELSSITHCIVCRPFDRASDQQLVDLSGLNSFVHLGASAEEIASLSVPADVETVSLDDINSLQLFYDEIRLESVERARRACEERTQLRYPAPSICMPHPRETLAAVGGL